MYDPEKVLLKINGLFFFAGSLSGIFISIFIFKLTNLRTVIFFDLVLYSFLLLNYLLSGFYLRFFSSRTLIKIGLILLIVDSLLLFIFREKSIKLLPLIALINGLGQGLYWSGNNLTQYIVTHIKSRNIYFGRLHFWVKSAQAVGPIIGGLIISVFNYPERIYFGYGLIFIVVALIDIFILIETRNLPRHANIKFNYSDILRNKKLKNWKIILTQQLLFGLWDVTFNTLSGIIIFLILKTEFLVGSVRTLALIVFALSSLVSSRNLQKNRSIIFPSSLAIAFCIWIFAWQQNIWGIISLLLISLAGPILTISNSKSIYDVIDLDKKDWQNKYHYFLERDGVLGIARVLTTLLVFIFMSSGNQLDTARFFLFIIPVLPLVIGFLQYKLVKSASQ